MLKPLMSYKKSKNATITLISSEIYACSCCQINDEMKSSQKVSLSKLHITQPFIRHHTEGHHENFIPCSFMHTLLGTNSAASKLHGDRCTLLNFKLNSDLSSGISEENIEGMIEYVVSKQCSTSHRLFPARLEICSIDYIHQGS